MKKNYLMTPGPTPVPPQALLAMAEPIIHHRTPEFMEIFKEVCELLKFIFQTQNPVITLTSSGTGAMEAA
ncbi:MAG TPA: alanine--glyoxylate aminotransferase family protein, partial [Candidatus Omnitrophota bacterium]|nr:alanine--glyoxylate aminotransferase family protein [Candidatus Omnitrophota bacterium]